MVLLFYHRQHTSLQIHSSTVGQTTLSTSKGKGQGKKLVCLGPRKLIQRAYENSQDAEHSQSMGQARANMTPEDMNNRISLNLNRDVGPGDGLLPGFHEIEGNFTSLRREKELGASKVPIPTAPFFFLALRGRVLLCS